jgi:hypothetical protein
MIPGKMKLLSITACAAAVIAAPALAYIVHNGAIAAPRVYGSHYVVGPDGKLIGSAPNSSIRSQWQQEGLPD